MVEIKLERGMWMLNESAPLGAAGGFGEVFRGQGQNMEVAVKRLKITASMAAHREMEIGKHIASKKLKHVVSILDYGQDSESDRYYIIMPICEYSLQDYINKNKRLSWIDAKKIVLDIVFGLLEVNDIIHRDLKPGNILWYQDRWQIADFGIAKFVEDSTSLNTLRECLTPSYAAPEQWLGEVPTKATDVYALGCILHAIINGCPPFIGDVEVVRRAHLNEQPPELKDVPPRLKSFITHMLRKSPNARPTLERCAQVFESIEGDVVKPVHLALAAAGQVIARQEAELEARRLAVEAIRRDRQAMGAEAIIHLLKSIEGLFFQIKNESESSLRQNQVIKLGPATLSYDKPQIIMDKSIDSHQAGWDIVAHSSMAVSSDFNEYSPQGSSYTFSSSLLYAKNNNNDYRWLEVSFWAFGADRSRTPFALHPNDRNFPIFFSKVIGSTQIAHGLLPIDAEDEEDFYQRWLTLFTKAVERKLRYPSVMPLPEYFFN